MNFGVERNRCVNIWCHDFEVMNLHSIRFINALVHNGRSIARHCARQFALAFHAHCGALRSNTPFRVRRICSHAFTAWPDGVPW